MESHFFICFTFLNHPIFVNWTAILFQFLVQWVNYLYLTPHIGFETISPIIHLFSFLLLSIHVNLVRRIWLLNWINIIATLFWQLYFHNFILLSLCIIIILSHCSHYFLPNVSIELIGLSFCILFSLFYSIILNFDREASGNLLGWVIADGLIAGVSLGGSGTWLIALGLGFINTFEVS